MQDARRIAVDGEAHSSADRRGFRNALGALTWFAGVTRTAALS
jgi:hypothetical protein